MLSSDPLDRRANSSLLGQYIHFTSLDSSRTLVRTVNSRSIVPIAVAFVRELGFVLLPSFAQAHLRKDSLEPGTLHATSHLDGLRGLAAFSVVICHMSYVVFEIGMGYCSGDAGQYCELIRLPIIRLLYSGPAPVAVFFVISGYALSLKPLRLMRSENYDTLLSTASSAVFRRGLRLFLPCIASTLLVLLLVRIGLYDSTRSIVEDRNLLRNYPEHHVKTLSTFWVQFRDWAHKISNFVHVWEFMEYGGTIDYDSHLWTIPVEYRASMVLFLVHLWVARLKTAIRFGVELALIWWAARWGRWEICLFLSGSVLAEYDLIRARRSSLAAATSSPSLLSASTWSITDWRGYLASPKRWHGPAWNTFMIFNFVCGLYFLSFPDHRASTTPFGFSVLETLSPNYITPHIRFWTSIGAVQLVLAVNSLRILSKPFNHPVVQYLGNISYAIYLMHGPVLHTWGYASHSFWWSITGTQTPGLHKLGFALSVSTVLPVIIWAADIFWRVVDKPSVRFAKWLETKMRCFRCQDMN